MDSVLEQHVEEPWRNVSPVGKELSVKCLGQDRPYLRVPVIHIGPCEAECDNLPSVIADQMQFEAMAPSWSQQN